MLKEKTTEPVLAKIHPKGLVTVPAPVRKRLGLEIGDIIQFEEKGDFFIIKPVNVTVSLKRKK